MFEQKNFQIMTLRVMGVYYRTILSSDNIAALLNIYIYLRSLVSLLLMRRLSQPLRPLPRHLLPATHGDVAIGWLYLHAIAHAAQLL